MSVAAENIEEIDNSNAAQLTGEFVKFSIADEGISMSEDCLQKIFDPYFTTKQMGRGLRLASVYSIVAKHHGRVSVVSELGVGTTFSVYLPAQKSAQRKAAALSSRVATSSAAGHILVMDDDEMIRDLLVNLLAHFGYSVVTAIDGTRAVEKYIVAQKTGSPFDAVIMDLTIPGGMGGKQALAKLLAIDSKAKVIIASGYSNDPVIANYANHGFKGRLVKPFRNSDLEQVLARVIQQE